MTDDTPILRTPIFDVLAEWGLYVSAGLIMAGLLRPSIYKPGMVYGGDELDILGVVRALAESGHTLIAVIVVLFSVIFPLAKTLTAAILFRFGNRASKRAAALMQFLGKWSMLDVFLAALLIAITQLIALRAVEPRPGLYLFAAGVILNNISTARLSFARAS